ncbi:hypothetical protein N657DRAFT_635672 [Parathielavia appendiculata]|uniref:Uncharacterized protein n=1 Tax=Parathielavia appendiculata TaxID=2587402 RepID=A0AAN6TW01_9PEZI|nr:hypothetical protein N657DRAFT_635672 [Parathielavia appendiculata]
MAKTVTEPGFCYAVDVMLASPNSLNLLQHSLLRFRPSRGNKFIPFPQDELLGADFDLLVLGCQPLQPSIVIHAFQSHSHLARSPQRPWRLRVETHQSAVAAFGTIEPPQWNNNPVVHRQTLPLLVPRYLVRPQRPSTRIPVVHHNETQRQDGQVELVSDPIHRLVPAPERRVIVARPVAMIKRGKHNFEKRIYRRQCLGTTLLKKWLAAKDVCG